ncbi:hypothetical protein EYF80_042561 [Liparis tanakae]|uniref:Uncharacterized protein n=1 Tax=Liparis tanakae TaxID=230148 RepID=A0A4Z2G2X9_9TELE|nr:hypothetical protein EYF80_042561 [Liparis tanakae]
MTSRSCHLTRDKPVQTTRELELRDDENDRIVSFKTSQDPNRCEATAVGFRSTVPPLGHHLGSGC